jgi:hypothetical protein
VDDEAEAHIVIAPDNSDDLLEERDRFEASRHTRVESYSWLLDSINLRYVEFTPPVPRRMPGRPPAHLRYNR